MWSAIPVGLLSVIVNWSEVKQGSGSEGDKVLWNKGGTFVYASVHLSALPTPSQSWNLPSQAWNKSSQA